MTQDPSGTYLIGASEAGLQFDAGHVEDDSAAAKSKEMPVYSEVITPVSHEPKQEPIPQTYLRTEADHQRYLDDLANQQMELQRKQETLACTTHVAELSGWVVQLRNNALAPQDSARQGDYDLAA